MLALEKCQVIVGGGSGAYSSLLSGKRHQGRTARRAGEPYTARLLVGDAIYIVVLSGLVLGFTWNKGRRLGMSAIEKATRTTKIAPPVG